MTFSKLYGLVVRSEIPLHQARAVPQSAPVDLDIILAGPVPADDRPPEGQIMLDMRGDKQFYTATRTANGYHLRFYGTCDVLIDADLRRAVVREFPGSDMGIISVLCAGAVLAFILGVRGDVVLHASAVQVGGGALGFVGASGMGKSTMATLLCADGGRLITDDLLRLDLRHDPPRCSLGATELRLRKSAGELSDLFASAPTRRTTGDDRDALGVELSDEEGLPLKALVIPAPDHTAELGSAVLERPDAMTAFLMLTRFPRLLGWKDEKIIARQFQQLGDVVDRVPVYVGRLPWGPPFDTGIGADVRQAVGIA